ncbi:MAG: hypothetical protein K2M71_11705 [Duncaniella sp.]|nr:hypothetical protein [Bacteroides sp.]MBD5318554.1 hypothetical protein [Bacteroides sp.]MDE7476283.1 hypothetical protein [Duncaniella sp.]
MFTIEIIAISPIDTNGIERVDSDAITTAPVHRRIVEVVSCDVDSHRL